MAQRGVRRATVLGAGIAGLALSGLVSGTAQAQMPPEAAEIGRCLCMNREVSSLGAAMSARMAALHRADRRVSDLDARLRGERRGLDVNNPVAVERYKALLERRDRAWKASVGPIWRAANAAVARYDGLVREYNGSCAHRLFDSVLMRRVRATLTCQAPSYGSPPAYGPPQYGPPESEYPANPEAMPPAPPEAGFPPPPPSYPGPR